MRQLDEQPLVLLERLVLDVRYPTQDLPGLNLTGIQLGV
jgi:hypothetical protein